jgi:hypothetical protein
MNRKWRREERADEKEQQLRIKEYEMEDKKDNEGVKRRKITIMKKNKRHLLDSWDIKRICC